MDITRFEWDDTKDFINQLKHGVSFKEAQQAFIDPKCIIAEDLEHGAGEERFFCFGRAGEKILTVRFTYRKERVRIIGAGCWRKGRAIYEKQSEVHGRADREIPDN